jgi:hypothetical protein
MRLTVHCGWSVACPGCYGVAAQLNVDHSHFVLLAPPPVLVMALNQTRPEVPDRLENAARVVHLDLPDRPTVITNLEVPDGPSPSRRTRHLGSRPNDGERSGSAPWKTTAAWLPHLPRSSVAHGWNSESLLAWPTSSDRRIFSTMMVLPSRLWSPTAR